ncbi:AraC family transcriptional regulator [Flammeovirga pectinis]|uniref:AraC family transcriptional regulator n=1 Tax=Flammeovirga pectinis TaxID=2494373 RepID=A0A3Q9FPB1_9BACT|nr:AraC family transcriptional regulator [Flammeovirga pectinis]AZQ61700.1 AraC family transcriptional regulator [Flammeovirga pectinis]
MKNIKVSHLNNPLADISKDLELPLQANGSLIIPSYLGEGKFIQIEVTKGLKILYGDYYFNMDVSFQREAKSISPSPLLNAIFQITSLPIPRIKIKNDKISNNVIYYNHLFDYQIFIPAYTPSKFLQILITEEYINEALSKYAIDYSTYFDKIFNERWSTISPFTLEMQKLVSTIHHNENKGFQLAYFHLTIQRLFFLTTEELINNMRQQETKKPIINGDLIIIYKLKNLLQSQDEVDTSLNDICQRFPISERKLQRDFKTIVGCSMMEFRKMKRLEQAYTMIKEGKYTISEIVFKVGYNSNSHFTHSFKNYFGFIPSDVKNIV